MTSERTLYMEVQEVVCTMFPSLHKGFILVLPKDHMKGSHGET